MTISRTSRQVCLPGILATLLLLLPLAAPAATPGELLQQLNDYPHAHTIDTSEREVIDYEVGLGAIRKVGGAWTFKRSERFTGMLTRYTWQIVDGFTSIEVMDELIGAITELEDVTALFSCDGRSCGQGVQWANRVFQQRVLYGREELQRYRVYSVGTAPGTLMVVYAAARTADRQYLHAELLVVAP